MRGVKWTLTACGIVGMILGVSAAQDIPNLDRITPAAETATEASSPSQFFSRRAIPQPDKSATSPRTLGTAESSAKPLPEQTVPPATSKYTRSRPFPLGARTPAPTFRDGQMPRQNYLNRLFREASAEAVQADRPSGLRQANYEQNAGATTGGQIRQAGATSEDVNPFAATSDVPAPTATEAINRLPLPGTESTEAGVPADETPKTTVTQPATPTPARRVTLPAGPQTPQITIQWIKQGDINVGQESRCQLHVTNSGKLPAKNVTIDAYFPESVRLTETVPAPAATTDHLTWRFPELSPGQQQIIEVRLIPSERGALKTSAFVSFTAAASSIFTVSEPRLAIAVEGPKEILVGEPASQVIRVSNPGTGVATNVKLEAVVPAGLEHLRGERLSMEIGSLNPGETRVVRLALGAVGGGEQVLNLQVVADGDLRQTGAKSINVIAPTLSAKLAGPLTRYVGRTAQYMLTVHNESDVASNNVRAAYKIPNGFQFLRADSGGRMDMQNGQVSWFIGRLEPGKSVSRTVHLTAAQTGAFVHSAAVTSEHGASAAAELATTIDATAMLALEIVERDDPVKVGADTGFEVRVRNDGSKAASNVGLSIELPPGVKYQSARGPSDFLAENGLLLFKSIGRLDPGKTAVYRVYVQGTSAGNHRIRARVASDSISEPLIGEEFTKFHVD